MSDILRMDLTGVGSGPMGPGTGGPGDTPFDNVLGNVLVAEDGPHGSYMSIQQQAGEPANGEWILGSDIATGICGGRVEVTHPGVASLSWTVMLAAPTLGGFGWRIDSSGPGRLRIRDNANAQVGAESTITFVAGTRYRLEWSISATNAEVRIFLGDDVNPTETMTRAGAFGPVGVIKPGPTTSSPTVPTFAMDSILVNDDGTFPGPWVAPVGRYDFRIDWDNDGYFEDPGDDVTDRELGQRAVPQMVYGRDQARSLTPTTSGRMSGLELLNTSRDYTPDNALSPIAGNVKPGRPLWVSYNDRMNLVPNPSFELNTTGWSSTRTTLTATANNPFVGGQACQSVVNNIAGTPTVDTLQFPVKPGKAYTVSAYLRLNTVGTRTAGLKMIFLRANGSITLNPSTVFTSQADTAGYVRRSKTDTAPADAAKAQVTIAYSTSDAALNDSWNIDGVMVEEGAILGTYFDGASTGAFWRTTAHGSASIIGTVLFRGHLEDFELNPDINNRSVTLGALDPLAKLREADVSTALFSGLRTGDAVHKVLDAIGWDANKRDIDAGASILPWWWEEGTDAYAALERLVNAEGPPALVTVDSVGRLVFRDRHHRLLDAASIASQTTFRDVDGSDGLRVTGNANSRASTPDNAALDIVADLDIRVRVAADDWTPAANQAFVGKAAGGGQFSYEFRLSNFDGRMQILWSADGTAVLSAQATRPTGFADGSLHWVRAALDVNNGASGRTITFYTSENGVNWVTLGTQVVQAGVTSIFASTTPVEVGARGDNTELFIGNVHYAEIRAGINGTAVASPFFAAHVAGTTAFTDGAGRLWTVHPPAAITGASEPKHSAPFGYNAGFGEVVNQVAFDVEERRPLGGVGVVWETEETFTVPSGGSQQRVFTAVMDDPVDSAVAPVSGTDFEVLNGVTVNGSLTRTSGQSIEIILSNTGGGADAVVSGLRLRARSVPVARTVKVELEDVTSRDEHGPRKYDRDAPFVNQYDAEAIGQLVINQRKQRLPTVTVRVLASPTTQPERFYPAIQRDLSDKVRILDTESAVDGHFFVEQIQHTIHQVGLQHEVELACELIPPEPLDEPSEVFVLDSTTNGVLDTNRLGH
ncbi:carbohydrate binding domain-containing protein [Tenggerimyces flavus]|uniref:Uncharacterized protein n=1 Tax=Tenggerimyces flavus TaxID=1708749 RepID=A0ABV7YB23_9ACTN|nr:hypothetical protein [Tenggerimyces flavus]MBM7788848.1 hypothetical protein [Tenggerimyces flavus]